MSETIVSAMLKKTALFGDLTLAERLALASTMRRGDVPKDAHVFHAGDPGRSFFLIVAGRIKISLSRQGREIVLAELGPGDLGLALGYTSLQRRPYPCEMETARARVFAACKKNRLAFLEGATPGVIAQRLDEGVRVIAGHNPETAKVGRAHQKRRMPI